LISFRDKSEKEIKMSIEIAFYNFKSVRFMLKDTSKKLEMKKYVLKSFAFPVLVRGVEKPTRNYSGEGTE